VRVYLYVSVTPFTLACQAGTIQVSKSTFQNLSQSADCTPYVASQCNGKSSCTLLFTGKADSCNAITIGDGTNSDYANADAYFSCSGTTVNAAPAGDTKTIFTDSPLPNYVADVDNVTASHFVNAPQPTVAANSNFIDVTQHGILPWGPTNKQLQFRRSSTVHQMVRPSISLRGGTWSPHSISLDSNTSRSKAMAKRVTLLR
jgi:hypothetical protein